MPQTDAEFYYGTDRSLKRRAEKQKRERNAKLSRMDSLDIEGSDYATLATAVGVSESTVRSYCRELGRWPGGRK